jgi:hypothetical protein
VLRNIRNNEAFIPAAEAIMSLPLEEMQRCSWMSATVVLFGAELNSEIERQTVASSARPRLAGQPSRGTA